MKKKGGFDIQKYLVGLLLFMGIMVSFGTVAYNMGSSYGTIGGASISGEFKETYNKTQTMQDITQDMQDKIEETDSGTEDADTQFYGDVLNSIKLVSNSLSTTRSMISEMASSIGIPVFWQNIFTTILIIMIITVMLFMIFKSRGTT